MPNSYCAALSIIIGLRRSNIYLLNLICSATRHVLKRFFKMKIHDESMFPFNILGEHKRNVLLSCNINDTSHLIKQELLFEFIGRRIDIQLISNVHQSLDILILSENIFSVQHISGRDIRFIGSLHGDHISVSFFIKPMTENDTSLWLNVCF